MNETDWDLIVIGGGIQGAGMAQAAAAAGYRCLVLEQFSTLAQGTSSRSSKLIHGGLRYLETGQFSLVRECLRERARLLHNAPQLVHLKPFYIPIYEDTRRSINHIRFGLLLYQALGGGAFQSIPQNQWQTLDGLLTHGLRRVFRYQDAQTDDATLTRAVMASACALGAQLKTQAQMIAAERNAMGYTVHYHQQGHSTKCTTRCLVNASGPWVQQVLSRIHPPVPIPPMTLVAGTHIRLRASLGAGLYYLEAPSDQRAVFAMPWQGDVLVGTTERVYTADPGQIAPTPKEVEYLQSVYCHYFPGLGRTAEIIDTFAGLRVLPGGSQASFQKPRDTLLHSSNPHLLSLYGGKLTAYRATAERVMAQLQGVLPRLPAIADTRTCRLSLPE